jgi:hypothetical protein
MDIKNHQSFRTDGLTFKEKYDIWITNFKWSLYTPLGILLGNRISIVTRFSLIISSKNWLA